eukprot:5072351-Pleurochrysis_carterae.AAC.3
MAVILIRLPALQKASGATKFEMAQEQIAHKRGSCWPLRVSSSGSDNVYVVDIRCNIAHASFARRLQGLEL